MIQNHLDSLYVKAARWLRLTFFGTKKPFVYVAIGDSAAEGIGASHPDRSYTGIIYKIIKEKIKKAQYKNFGKIYSTLQNIIDSQLEKTIAEKPNLITISVGANDIQYGTKISQFEKNLLHLIDMLQKETNAIIVINNIPDFSLAPAVPRHLKFPATIQINRFNKSIQKMAKLTNIIFVDLHSSGKVYLKHYPESLAGDNFHPSDFGYAIWANTIMGSLYKLLFLENKFRLD